MKYVFTFPIRDRDRADSYCVVDAVDETAARMRMIDRYGRDGWAGCYPADTDVVRRYDLTEIAFGQ